MPSVPNEQTLQAIYNVEVATNLLRKYIVTQDQTNAFAQIYTLLNTATAVNANMNTFVSNWSNLP
jgi:hypothetical protein